MSAERSIEVTGESVEEAIAKGLQELNANPTEVIVEVLEEPSRGVLGIGARPARVRLQLLAGLPKPPMPPPAAPVVPPPAPKVESKSAPKSETKPASRSEPKPKPETKPMLDFDIAAEDEELPLLEEADTVVPENELDDEASVGKVVLGELLERMALRLKIVVRRPKPSKPGEVVPWILDITGNNASRLVGKRGETLAALQYITRLITSRELQRRANVIVDVEGYKSRRARMLQGLALRMAEQAVEQGRVITLEPMPPHERRIIHLTLREHPDVTTRSVGEGSGRKVTIVPKSAS